MFCPSCGASLADNAAFCPSCGAKTSPGASAPVASASAGASVWDYATWATRVGGYLIDSILVGIGMAVIYFIAGGILTSIARVGGESAAGGTCCLLILLFPLATLAVGLYNRVYLVSQRGYSIGQGVVHVKVVDSQGQLLSQGTAFVRLLAQAAMGFVPFLPLLDLLWPLWDERRQTLHDKAVGCYVINNPEGRA